MKYQEISQTGQCPYPSHDVPEADKGWEWCMQYAKAAYYDFSVTYPKGMFSNNGGDYAKNKMYAIGKQPIDQYKPYLGVKDGEDNWLNLDWSVRPIITPYRNKVLSRCMGVDYDFVCTPIDALAKTQETEYYNRMKVKLAMIDLIKQQDPELANHPMLKISDTDPTDLSELEMRVEFGEQFNRSKDAEISIDLGMYENNYTQFRKQIFEDLFDNGYAGYKCWLGTDNRPKFRRVNCDNVICSMSKDQYFTDMVHAGEIIYVPLVELATKTKPDGTLMFTEEELTEFASTIAGKYGNPRRLGTLGVQMKPYDKFKCAVLEINFKTYNYHFYAQREEQVTGNTIFKDETSKNKGISISNPKYINKRVEYIYKASWIIGTDKCYDTGMCYDQYRSNNLEKIALTRLPYRFIAYNFNEMRAQSFMDALIPFLDDYQMTMMKIQNFKARAVPSGWWIDFDALENVAKNKAGKNMTPQELLQMFFQTGVLGGRSVDDAGNPRSPNWKPIIPIENTAASELQMFYQDLVMTIQQIERITGFNDITTGNPNPKTLVPGYEIAQQSTTDALSPLVWAEETLSCWLAEDVLCRMQQGVRKAGIEGYAPALNSNILKAISVNPDIAWRDYGVYIEKKPTEQERMWLMQMMQKDIDAGILSGNLAITLINTKNAKQAQQIWAYRVDKERQRQQQARMDEIQATNQGNLALSKETAKAQETLLDKEYAHKERIKGMEIYADLEKKRMETEASRLNSQETNAARVLTQHVANEGKKELEQTTQTT